MKKGVAGVMAVLCTVICISAIHAQEEILLIGPEGYAWEFDDPAEFDRFSVNHAEIRSCADGAVSGISVPSSSASRRHDPMIFLPALELTAEDIPVIRVGISYTVDRAGYKDTGAYIFFRTEERNFSTETYATVKTDVEDTDGQFVEYIFDMTKNELWTGKILALRFDPYEAGPEGSGSFSIDYIRLEGTARAETTEQPEETESVRVPADSALSPADTVDCDGLSDDSASEEQSPENAGVPAFVYPVSAVGIVTLSVAGAAVSLRRRRGKAGNR